MKLKLNLDNGTIEYLDKKPFIQGYSDTQNIVELYCKDEVNNIKVSYTMADGKSTIALTNRSEEETTLDDEDYYLYTFGIPQQVTTTPGQIMITFVVTTSNGVSKFNALNTIIKSSEFESLTEAVSDNVFIQELNAQGEAITELQQEMMKKLGIDTFGSLKVDELPETGETGIIYYVKIEDEEIYDVYFWNALTTAFVFMGTTSCGLYTSEEGKAFEEEVNGEIEEFEGTVNDRLDEQDETIAGLGQLQPSGVDTSTNILAFNEDKGIYIGTDTGHWYYWDGTQYVDSGYPYQATQVQEGSISYDELDNDIEDKLFDKEYTDITTSITIEDGKYINKSNGNIESANGTYLTDYIDIETTPIYVSGKSQYATCLYATYDSSYNLISTYGYDGTNAKTWDRVEIKATNNVKYCRCSSIQLPLVIETLEYKSKVDGVEDELVLDETHIKNVTSQYTLENKYVSKSNGILYDDNNSKCTDFIPVTTTDKWYISGYSQYLTCLIAVYDENKSFLRYYGNNTQDAYIYDEYEYIPLSDEKYAIFGTYKYNNYPLIIGKEEQYTLKDKVIDLSANVDFVNNDNVLYGKKYVACGDSFTDGDQVSRDKVYPYLIAQRNGMKLLNMGRNGGYAHYTTDNASFLNPNSPIYYQNIPSDADYITIAFGLNELSQTLGTYTSSDNTTIWGAYNEVLAWLITNRPNAKIGIIANDAWFTETFRDALKDIAKYWGVCFLDLKDEKVPLMIGRRYYDVSWDASNARTAQYRISSDNNHPNELGHKVRSYIIENWMKTL